MKTKKWLLRAFALVGGVVALAACKDEPKDGVKLPEQKSINVFALEHGVLEFDAPGAWRLSSDKPWLVFTEDDQETTGFSSRNGVAGASTVNYYVSDLAQSEGPSTANITLTASGKSKTIFKLVRTGEGRWVKIMYLYTPPVEPGQQVPPPQILEREDNVQDFLTFNYDKNIRATNRFRVGFYANFDWKVKSVPAGVSMALPFTGAQDAQPTNIETEFKSISIKTDSLPYKIDGYSKPADQIVISDLSGEYEFTFNIYYNTMGNFVFFTPSNFATSEFSEAGLAINPVTGRPFEADTNQDPPVLTGQTEITGRVYIKNMTYKAYIVEKIEGVYTDVTSTGWLHVANDLAGNLTLTADAQPNAEAYEREAYLVVVPSALNVGNMETGYANNGNAIKIKQRGVPRPVEGDPGFYLKWDNDESPVNMSNLIKVTPDFYSSMGINNTLAARLPAENTYVYMPSGSTLYAEATGYKGNLAVAPLCGAGVDGGDTLYDRIALNESNWSGVTFDNLADADSAGHPGIKVKGLGSFVKYTQTGTNPNTGEPIMGWKKDENSIGILLFYDSLEAKFGTGNAVAALIIDIQ